MTGVPDFWQVSVTDPDTSDFYDLADWGVLSFTVENSGPSLLALNSGASGPTATINLFTQESMAGAAGTDWGPFGLDSSGGLHIKTGWDLKIFARTQHADTTGRNQNVFLGTVTAVDAITDTYHGRDPGSLPPGWERGWSIKATTRGVDLGEVTFTGTLPFTFVSPEVRAAELVAGAGSIWSAVPCILDLEGGGTPRIDKVGFVATADMGTITSELDRFANSTWAWWAFQRDPLRWGHGDLLLIRFVPRESLWRPAAIGMPGRTRARLIGDPWLLDFPLGTYTGGGTWSALMPGVGAHVDATNYLHAVTVKPYNTAQETNTITGVDTFMGGRVSTFDGHVGSSTGHADSETHGFPPSGGGGAGWQISVAWSGTTAFVLDPHTDRLWFDNLQWEFGANQYHNGNLLDLDRLDPLWAVWNDKVIPLRCQSVRITASPGDWRVTATVERVDPYTTFDVPTTHP